MRRASILWPLALVALAAPQLVAQVRPPAPAGQATTAPARSTGMIAGQVVDASSGDPVPEAIVTMTLRGGGPGGGRSFGVTGRAAGAAPFGRGADPNQTSQLTGAVGRFVFSGLAPGTYSFAARAPGYVGTGAGPGPMGAPAGVTLTETERRTDVRIRVWKHAVISGLVVDDAGEPAVGIMVQVLRRTMSAGRPRYSYGGIGRTDDRGLYRVASLTPGDYIVAVPQTSTTIPASTVNSMLQGMAAGMTGMTGGGGFELAMAQGGANSMGGLRVGDHLMTSSSGAQPVLSGDGKLFVYQTLLYASATTASQATLMKLASGEERSGIDFQLRLLPTSRISGTIVGPLGPAGGVNVRLLASGDDRALDGSLDAATAIAAADGSFMFLGVPAGRYLVSVVKPPRPPIPAGMGDSPMAAFAFGSLLGKPSPQDSLTLFGEAAVTLAATDITDVSVTLTEGVKVSGRVEFEGSAPRPPAQQLQGVTITMTGIDVVSSGFGFGRADRLDDQAQFRTQGHPPGRYFIATSSIGGQATWQLKSVTAGGRDVFNAPLELRDADVSDIVITYTDRVAEIAGAVRNPAGTKSPNATIVLFPADYRTWIANGMNVRRLRTIRAGSTGDYTLAALIAGEYLIAAVEENEVVDTQDPAVIETLARVAVRVTLGDAEKRSLDLQIGRKSR